MMLLFRLVLSLTATFAIITLLSSAQNLGVGRRIFVYLLGGVGLVLAGTVWQMARTNTVQSGDIRSIAWAVLWIVYILAIWGIVRRKGRKQ